MYKWGVYIKSHCLAPDFEGYTYALTKEDAIRQLLKDYPSLNEFGADDLWEMVDIVEYIDERR